MGHTLTQENPAHSPPYDSHAKRSFREETCYKKSTTVLGTWNNVPLIHVSGDLHCATLCDLC